MTSARDSVHAALLSRLTTLLAIPVRVGVTSRLPYVRLGEDTEQAGEGNKTGESSICRPMISVFSESFDDARAAASSIAASLRADPPAVAGFRVTGGWASPQIIPVPEFDENRTVFGERLIYELTTEPT